MKIGIQVSELGRLLDSREGGNDGQINIVF